MLRFLFICYKVLFIYSRSTLMCSFALAFSIITLFALFKEKKGLIVEDSFTFV